MEVIKSAEIWKCKVSNFSKLLSTSTVYSPKFSINDNIEIQFSLRPSFVLYTDSDDEYLFIAVNPNHYVLEEKNTEKTVFIKCRFFIQTVDNDRIKLSAINITDFNKAFFNSNGKIKREKLLANAEKYLPNDCLTLFCEVSSEITTPDDDKHMFNFVVPKSKQNKLFESLLEYQTIGRMVTVRFTNNEEIQALKGVLIFHSPVFAAMLEHQENLVIIEEVSPEVFKQMLFFMLTGELPESNVNFKELLAAASMFQMDCLKALCEKAVYNKITIENSSEYFVDADQYDAPQLRQAAKEFIKKHLDDVVETDGYAVIKYTCPQLVVEIFEEVSLKKKRKQDE